MLKDVKEVFDLKISTMLGVSEKEFLERSKVFKGVLCNNLTMYFRPDRVISLPTSLSEVKLDGYLLERLR